MALEPAFQDLCDHLQRLQKTLVDLQPTVEKDSPAQGKDEDSPAQFVVTRLREAIFDVMGPLEEGLEWASAALKAVRFPVDLERARSALGNCQERFHEVETAYSDELASFDRLKDLNTLGRSRRGQYRSWGKADRRQLIKWATAARRGIDLCRPPMDGIRKALAGCWREVAERAETSISVRVSSIGQKIMNPVVAPKGVEGMEQGDS